MNATVRTLQGILHSPDRYIIPLFQRYYSWKREHWQQLRNDIWELLDREIPGVHFMGPMVCAGPNALPGELPAYHLIDGQQRLTTLTLLLAALRDVASEVGEDSLAQEINEYYLINKLKAGLERYHVVPRLGDRESMVAILEGQLEKIDDGLLLCQAYRYFHRHIRHLARIDPGKRLKQLFTLVVGSLQLVVIAIDGENPYEIFESLNSTGLELKEADLVRNYVFMKVPMAEQASFHEQHWAPFEAKFDEIEGHSAVDLTGFFRNYLMRDGNYVSRDGAFEAFKKGNPEADLDPVQQATDLSHFADLYIQIQRPALVAQVERRRILKQIACLDIGTAYPLVLRLLGMADGGEIDEGTLVGCLGDLASFVLRRSVCGESTRRYGHWFADAIGAIKESPRSDLQEYWLHRNWPHDDAFHAALVEFPVYRRESKKTRMMLEALEESFKHKEKVDLDKLTIEHVMPQSISDTAAGQAWQDMLGDEWKTVHETWLHALGNLSLTAYNAELSNSAFATKQAELAKSHIDLNHHFVGLAAWDGEAIRQRGQQLADQVVGIWPRPATGSYTASHEAAASAEKPSSAREFSLAYWGALRDFLAERGSPLEIKGEPGSTDCYFQTTFASDVRIGLRAWQSRREKALMVGMIFQSAIPKHIYRRVRDARTDVEKEVRWPIEWSGDESSQLLMADRSNINFWDRDDWEIQHAWLADRLEELLAVIVPRIRGTGLLGHVGFDRQQFQMSFWTGFAAYLGEKGYSTTGIPTPSVQHWMSFSTGKSGVFFAAVALHWDDNQPVSGLLRLELCFGDGKAGARFDSLRKKADEITEGLGAKPTWHPAGAAKGRRLYLATHTDLFDRENWPNAFAWLHDQLLRFQDTFRPMLQELD